MTNTQHTGPWEEIRSKKHPGAFFYKERNTDNFICKIYKEAGQANARLIAAAPELLEALEAAERELNEIGACLHHCTEAEAKNADFIKKQLLIIVRAVIAKAKGQS